MDCIKEHFWIAETFFISGFAISLPYLFLRYDVSLPDVLKIFTGRKQRPDDWRLTLILWITAFGSLGFVTYQVQSCASLSATSGLAL